MDKMNLDTFIDCCVVVKRDNQPIMSGMLDKYKGNYIVLSGNTVSWSGVKVEEGRHIDQKYGLYYAYEVVDGDEITQVSPYEVYATNMFLTRRDDIKWERKWLLNVKSDAEVFLGQYNQRNDLKNIIKRESRYLGRDTHIDSDIDDVALMTLYRQTRIARFQFEMEEFRKELLRMENERTSPSTIHGTETDLRGLINSYVLIEDDTGEWFVNGLLIKNEIGYGVGCGRDDIDRGNYDKDKKIYYIRENDKIIPISKYENYGRNHWLVMEKPRYGETPPWRFKT